MKLSASPETKEFLIAISIAGVIFWLITKTVLKKDDGPAQPPVTPENIDISLSAYMAAFNNNEPESVLNELNTSTARDYGIRVYEDKSKGGFVATDLSGKELKRA